MKEPTELEKLKAEIARLHDIITRASVQFCDDSPNWEVSARMFEILGEARRKQS